MKSFLRLLVILSYSFIFISKEQKAGYIQRWSFLTDGLHCRAMRWGLATLLQNLNASVMEIFSLGSVSFSLEGSSCLRDIIPYASVLGVKEGRKLWISLSNMRIFIYSLFLNPCAISKDRNHTSNSNRGKFNVRKY